MKDQLPYVVLLLIALAIIYFIYVVIKHANLKVKHEELKGKLTTSQETNNKLLNDLNEQRLDNMRFDLNKHSFKNTLDSIKTSTENTLSSISDLEDILKYMLYDTPGRYIKLKKEAEFALKYFNLYKQKESPKPIINMKIDPLIEESEFENLMVAPLITAHFIENAFMHADLKSEDSFIKINLELLPPRSIIYSISNKTKFQPFEKKYSGVGTSTFEGRLNVLYDGKFQLDSKIENGIYTSNLKIDLHVE